MAFLYEIMVFEINSETKWPSQQGRQGVGILQSQASLHPEYPVFTDGKLSPCQGKCQGPSVPPVVSARGAGSALGGTEAGHS